jgi:hypothetical protein
VSASPASQIASLLGVIDRAYDRASWHGVNLRGSLRRVAPPDAAWRPHPERHNIWETAVHCAYWKYAVWRALTGAPRGSFPLTGSNWFRRPIDRQAPLRLWRDDLALLGRMHADLRAAVAEVRPAALHRRLPRSRYTAFDLIAGAAAHDLYHAGQIQLLKALRKSSSGRSRA